MTQVRALTACGPALDDHEWGWKEIAGVWIEVRCGLCRITPMEWLGQQPIVKEKPPDKGPHKGPEVIE